MGNSIKALANWWELNRKNTHRDSRKEVEILLLADTEFSNLLRHLEHPDSIRSLCEFLKGAIAYHRLEIIDRLRSVRHG